MKQNIIKIIVVYLLVSVILCFCFILKNYNHTCTHSDDCPTCILLNQVKDNMKNIGFNLGLIIIFCFVNTIQEIIFKIGQEKINLTLVSLNVRLNN